MFVPGPPTTEEQIAWSVCHTVSEEEKRICRGWARYELYEVAAPPSDPASLYALRDKALYPAIEQYQRDGVPPWENPDAAMNRRVDRDGPNAPASCNRLGAAWESYWKPLRWSKSTTAKSWSDARSGARSPLSAVLLTPFTAIIDLVGAAMIVGVSPIGVPIGYAVDERRSECFEASQPVADRPIDQRAVAVHEG